MKTKSEAMLPPSEHSPACREAGPPDMVWQAPIGDLPLVGHCRRCGAVARKAASR